MTHSLGVVSMAVILARAGAPPANSMTMTDESLQIVLLDEEISARNRLSVHRAGLLRWRRLTPIGKERKRRLHAPKPHETLNL